MKAVALALLLVATAGSLPGSVPWEQLAEQVSDRKVVVEDADGNKFQGVLREIRKEEIVFFRESGETIAVPKEKVVRISISSRKRGAMWGAIIGAAAGGVFIGAAYAAANDRYKWIDLPAREDALILGGLVAATAGVGSGVGALIGGSRTIYRSPSNTPETKAFFRRKTKATMPITFDRVSKPPDPWNPTAALPAYLARETQKEKSAAPQPGR